jgi:hypothetical protein
MMNYLKTLESEVPRVAKRIDSSPSFWRPLFIGYLPRVVDGLLLELVNMSYKQYPLRRGRTGAQLSESRILAIDGLRLFFKRKSHQPAIEVVANALRPRKPFCLYLRNFGLGPRVYSALHDPSGLPQ